MIKNKITKQYLAIFILSILIVFYATKIIYSRFSYSDFKYRDYLVTEEDYKKLGLSYAEGHGYYVSITEKIPSMEELKKLIEQETTCFYIYREVENFKYEDQWGTTNLLLNYVKIKKELDTFSYVITLTHELTHVKYQTGNDMYVSYKTFIALYESKNEFLHNMGQYYALNVLLGYEYKDYDCGYYILEYIRNQRG